MSVEKNRNFGAIWSSPCKLLLCYVVEAVWMMQQLSAGCCFMETFAQGFCRVPSHPPTCQTEYFGEWGESWPLLSAGLICKRQARASRVLSLGVTDAITNAGIVSAEYQAVFLRDLTSNFKGLPCPSWHSPSLLCFLGGVCVSASYPHCSPVTLILCAPAACSWLGFCFTACSLNGGSKCSFSSAY